MSKLISVHKWVPEVQSKLQEISDNKLQLPSNEIVDHSDVVGASPAGAAPTTSSFST